ncbi:MAG: hypothetical protein WA989_06615 [Henriciella sp.]|uniref:hypothetical protein n=1 Tax=Henriciella sp. TaxID=1968823 RepID=UPI003C7920CC
MKAGRLASLGAVFALAGCAVLGAPQDIAIPVAADYQAREQAQMKPHDSCGPEFMQAAVPGLIRAVLEPLADGPFRASCRRHDACYRLQEHSQAWCDERFREEMVATCNTGTGGLGYSLPGIGPPLCRVQGGLYFSLVSSPGGAAAYKGEPGGQIANLRHRIVRRAPGEDQVTACVDIANETPVLQGYVVDLRDKTGRQIDRAPFRGQLQLRTGESGTLCVGTTGSRRYGLPDFADGIYAVLSADDPSRYAAWGDLVVVDQRQVVLD